MDEETFNQKVENGEIKQVENTDSNPPVDSTIPTNPKLEDFIDILSLLRRRNNSMPVLDAVPTKDAIEGTTVLVDTGIVQKICTFLNGSWQCNLLTEPTAGATIAFPNTQVFYGTPPNASAPAVNYTDLDLSAVVGTKTSLVLLKVINYANSGGILRANFRQNGETITWSRDQNDQTGANTIKLNSSTTNDYAGYVICPTDANGIVEWNLDAERNPVEVRVEAYIN